MCVLAGDAMKYYNIAGLILSVFGNDDPTTLERMTPYEIEGTGASAHVAITVSKCDAPISLPGDNCVSVSSTEIWHVDDDALTYYLYFAEIGGAAVSARFSPDFSQADICMYDIKKNLAYDDKCYLFNTFSNVLHYIALMHDGLVFHSSSVCVNGVGIAFSASSGVGKSTHTGLWMDNIPNTFYINDDTPLISYSDDGIFISGSPFAGTSGINTNTTVPLKAIVFVTRGEDNKLVPVDAMTAFARIMSQLKKPVNDAMSDKMISTLNQILSKVPCYLMECNISSDAAFTAYNTIFEKN